LQTQDIYKATLAEYNKGSKIKRVNESWYKLIKYTVSKIKYEIASKRDLHSMEGVLISIP